MRLSIATLLVVLCPAIGAAQSLSDMDFATLRAEATDSGRDIAGRFQETAQQAAEQGNWAAAYKGHAEAAAIAGEPGAVLAAAVALARIPRDRDGCDNGFAVKLSDLSEAYALIASATRLDARPGRTRAAFGEVTDVARALGETLGACE